MLYTANLKPIEERINFKKLDEYLSTEFANNALNLPYVFSVINKDGNIVYQSGEIKKQPMVMRNNQLKKVIVFFILHVSTIIFQLLNI